MAYNKVDLPEPERPITETKDPFLIFIEIDFKTVRGGD
jgi:hypothetical protein